MSDIIDIKDEYKKNAYINTEKYEEMITPGRQRLLERSKKYSIDNVSKKMIRDIEKLINLKRYLLTI